MERLFFLVLILSVCFGVSGCRSVEKNGDSRRDIEYRTVEEEEIPEEMRRMIAGKKENAFWITYGDKKELYIGRGYGKRKTSGYSISVDACYETEETIGIHTSLTGPSADREEMQKTVTCPYLVICVKWCSKPVVFEGR